MPTYMLGLKVCTGMVYTDYKVNGGEVHEAMQQWGCALSKLRNHEAFGKLLETSLSFVVSGSIPFPR